MTIERLATVSYATAGFGNLLTHDLARGAPAAQAFFPAQSWEYVAGAVDARDYPRERLHQILLSRARESNAPQAVLANIDRLREPGVYVIATGQQAGLAGGPLYTLYKALTAVKLARTLEASTNGRARFVPVFWVAGDDHDLAEIDHADFIAPDQTVRRIRVNTCAENAGRSACDVALPPAEVAELRKGLRDIFPDAEGAADAIAAAYEGRTLSEAFGALLNAWFGPLGLVVVQSNDVRMLGADVLQRALADYAEIGRLIAESGVALEQRGYKPGFSGRMRPGPPFFITTESDRIRARLEPLDGGMFRETSPAFEPRGVQPKTYSRKDLEQLIAREPQRFSAGASLRPVLQQSILPVAAVVLGPGEIDYWAQLGAVHRHFGAPFPLIVPRATMTLLDSRALVNLRRLGLDPGAPELFDNGAALQKKLLAGGEVNRSIASHTAAILAELDAMAADVHAIDKGLRPLFEKARERFAHELERVAQKTAASISQREGAGLGRVQHLVDFVRPRHSPQERVLTGAQFIALDAVLPEALLEAIDPMLREHVVVGLSGA